MDILSDIYNLIKDDPLLVEHVGTNYMYNDMPNVSAIDTAYIAINPVINGVPVDYSDGKRIADAKSARVDVLLKAPAITSGNPRLIIQDIMERIADILDDNHYAQTASFTPEYDKEHELYRESRSFEINYYRSDF
ncbi:hypothetical protein [Salinicoccus roseus]|uniref:hypothetical protein n=1 Tax=Salinicoccus roseus TaxID=45670 RepID=UPI0023016654|nr:hypothetical protein [Salinicoccus roseus]